MPLEICIDSLESAVNAEQGGAHRLEVCASLPSGGLTPSLGLLKCVKQRTKLPAYCMLRCRSGDFQYSNDEMEVMMEDLKGLKNSGADGFVFGALNRSGSVDRESCGMVVRLAGGLPCTFHRAFDVCNDWKESLEEIINLGFTALLTSGQKPTAQEGMNTLTEIIQKAQNRIEIMPGSGVNSKSIEILKQSLPTAWFHGSASVIQERPRAGIEMGKSEEILRVTSVDEVRKIVSLLN